MVGISFGDGLHDRMIGRDVNLEDRPVDGLRRIMLGVGIVCDGRIVRHRGASAAAQHQPEDDRRTHSQLALAAGDPSRGAIFKHLNFSGHRVFGVPRRSGARIFQSPGAGVKTAVIAVLSLAFSAAQSGQRAAIERSTIRRA
jgi:hypothetical protein